MGCQSNLSAHLDGATTEQYSTFFVEEEGKMSSFQGLREVIEARGLFSSLYTDRSSHNWYTEETGGTVDMTRTYHSHQLTQTFVISVSLN